MRKMQKRREMAMLRTITSKRVIQQNYEEAKASRTEFILQMYSLLYDGLANSNIKNKNRSNNNKEKK